VANFDHVSRIINLTTKGAPLMGVFVHDTVRSGIFLYTTEDEGDTWVDRGEAAHFTLTVFDLLTDTDALGMSKIRVAHTSVNGLFS
jgi:hypothetical protein